MTPMKLTVGAALAAGIVAAPSLASTAVFTITYTGALTSGYDYTGEFGAPLTDLGGDTYTLTFLYDTRLGPRDTVPGTSDELYGGWYYATSSRVSASLNINGHTKEYSGNYIGYVYAEKGFIQDVSQVSVSSSNVSEYSYVDIYAYSGAFLPNLDTSLPATTSYVGGHFIDNAYNPTTNTNIDVSNGFLSYGAATVQISAVPEPATWTLMVLGFGLIGAGLRRRTLCTSKQK